jgi:G3E family GTPase
MQISSLPDKQEKLIPANIITGFLGVGKTTAIRHLLTTKPTAERWSILVNEFGEIGIDGAILQDTNAQIREVPGGCICCVADLPMKIALNMLINKTNPDRILIEPTGLGHPADIINALTGENYSTVLDLRATITLLDSRKLQDTRYTENEIFQDQIAVSDVLIANKDDLANDGNREDFHNLLQTFNPPKKAWAFTTQGQIDPALLDLERQDAKLHHPNLHKNKLNPKREIYNNKIQLDEDQDFLRRENQSQGFFSCGWLFKPQKQFNFNQLFGWITGLDVLRAKAVMNTDQGIYMFNAENGVLSVNPAMLEIDDLSDSRIELINDREIPANDYEIDLLNFINHKVGLR